MALAKTGGTSDSNDLTYEPCISRGTQMPSRSMQVTIALLPVSLSLVHIPRSRLDSLSQSVVRQLLHPNSAFLNITCNEIELSLFAEHHNLDTFEQIARKDSQRSRSGSFSSRKSMSQHSPTFEPVEISYDRWCVLQVDSHSDQIGDTSGTRVYDLSGPLAAAGISILYQSSYTSDFIFVKESRLQEAMSLFSASGFDLYAADSHSPSSPLYSPVTDDCVSADIALASCQKGGAILTCNVSEMNAKNRSNSVSSVASHAVNSPRPKSHSPTAGEVSVLLPDLACVGLSDDLGIDHWGLKIIKLIAFPDLIPSLHSTFTQPSSTLQSSVTIPVPISRSPPSLDLSLGNEFLVKNYSSSENSSPISSDEDGYFSHSPQSVSASFLATNSSHSHSDLALTSSGYKSPSKHPLSNDQAPYSALSVKTTSPSRRLSAAKPPSKIPFFSFTRTAEGSSLTADVNVLAALFPPKERHMVICSGELDAADLRVKSKRYNVELYSSDEDEEGLHRHSNKLADLDISRSRSRNRDKSTSSSYKCLQIDLRGFGLDKHGLVNRFSRVLEENGINHMYSSTFKTANVLVDKKDALRAQSLLRSC